MKRILILFAAILLLAVTATAQKLSYSSVVRNSANELMANKTIIVTISVANSATGDPVYSETQTVTTNQNGLLTLTIGEDHPGVVGNLSDVTWSTAYITTTYTIDGMPVTNTMPVNAVPYAIYAESAGSGGGTPVNDATLTIQKNGTTLETFSANQETPVTLNFTITPDDIIGAVGQMTSEQKAALRDALNSDAGITCPTLGATTITPSTPVSQNESSQEIVMNPMLSSFLIKTAINNYDADLLDPATARFVIRYKTENSGDQEFVQTCDNAVNSSMPITVADGYMSYLFEEQQVITSITVTPYISRIGVCAAVAPITGEPGTYEDTPVTQPVISSNFNVAHINGFYTADVPFTGGSENLTVTGRYWRCDENDDCGDEEGINLSSQELFINNHSVALRLADNNLNLAPNEDVRVKFTLRDGNFTSEESTGSYEEPNCPITQNNSTEFIISLVHGVYTANVPFNGGSNVAVSATFETTDIGGLPLKSGNISSSNISIQNKAIVLNLPVSTNEDLILDADQYLKVTATLTDLDDNSCSLELIGTCFNGQLGCTNYGQTNVEKSGNNVVVTMPFSFSMEGSVYDAAQSYCEFYDGNDNNYGTMFTPIFTTTPGDGVTISEDPEVEDGYIMQCVVPYTSPIINYSKLRVKPYVKVWCVTDVNYTTAPGMDGYYPPYNCPTFTGSTTSSISGDGKLTLTTSYQNYDGDHVTITDASYTLDAGDGNSVIIQATMSTNQITTFLSANTLQTHNLYGKTLTVTPHLMVEGCGNAKVNGTPVTVQAPSSCPNVGTISYDFSNGKLVVTATVTNPYSLTLDNLTGQINYNNGAGIISLPLNVTYSGSKLTGSITLYGDMEGKTVTVSLSAAVAGCGTISNNKTFNIPTFAHVGDVLCTDGSFVKANALASSGKTARGVVFHVDATGLHGWAVNLYDDTITYSGVPWASDTSRDVNGIANRTTTETALADVYGKSNTDMMRHDTFFVSHPVIEVIDESQGRYLPALGQLKKLSDALTTVNSSINILSSLFYTTEISGNYWSSTEYSRSDAWYMNINNGYHSNTSKVGFSKVRSIIDF